MFAATRERSANQANVSIVASQSERHITGTRKLIVGGIQVEPPLTRTINRHPGVRRVAAKEFWLAVAGLGLQIAAHIPRRQPQRAQAANFQMGEVLAYTATETEHLRKGVETFVAVLSNRKSA